MNRFFARLFQSIPRAFRSQRWRRSKFVRFTIGIVLTLILAILFPQVQSPQNVTGYSVGALWTSSDVVAPFNFRLFKEPHKYRTEVTKALENYYPVFVVDTSAKRRSVNAVTSTLFALTDSDNNESLRKVLADAELSSEEIAQLATYAGEQRSLTAKSQEAPFERMVSVVEKLYDGQYIYHTIPAEYNSPGRIIAIRKRANEEVLDTVGHLVSFEEAKNILSEQLDKKVHQRAAALTKVITQLLVPNIVYDKDASDESRKTIAARVPKTEGVVLEGQKIIGKGEVITLEAKAALESLAEARIEQGGTAAQIGRALGTIGHVFIIVSLFVLYVKFIRRRIYKDNAQLLLISLILVFPALLAYASVL
ncbi:MAG TPA: hypothetical protein VFO76_13105, partial [Candidatus Kapabacteria bacterium]|nr:hypothetical protein [Candidatus Kapabacteria bacterium]